MCLSVGLRIIQLNWDCGHGSNVSTERLETFWTSRLGLVSNWRHWRLTLVTPTSRSRLGFDSWHSSISVSSPSRDSNDSVSASYVSFTTLLNAISKVSIAAEVTGITWCWNSLRHISLLACQNWMQSVTRYLRTEGATEILWYFSSISMQLSRSDMPDDSAHCHCNVLLHSRTYRNRWQSLWPSLSAN